MKHISKFIALISIAGLISCNQEKEKPVIINTPAAAPAPVVIEKQTPAPVEKKEEGTTIKIGKGGVSYENKSGSNVKISKDSSSVIIKAPK